LIKHSRKNRLKIDTDSESSSSSDDEYSEDRDEYMEASKKQYLVQVNHKVLDEIVDNQINNLIKKSKATT